MNLLRLLGLVALLVAPATSGAQDVKNLAFDVASVRPQSRPAVGGSRTGIRYHEPGTTLQRVIQFAYDLPGMRIEGGPKWIETELWAIEATTLSPATVDEMRLMVKALLADRFELRTRVESRERSVFDLRVAGRDGTLGPNVTSPNCTPVGARSIQSFREAGEIACGPASMIGIRADGTVSRRFYGVTMTELAKYIEPVAGRVVRDRTGLSGAFDIELSYLDMDLSQAINFSGIREQQPVPLPDALPLPTALQKQLGLKLESVSGFVDVLVIESVARPTPN